MFILKSKLFQHIIKCSLLETENTMEIPRVKGYFVRKVDFKAYSEEMMKALEMVSYSAKADFDPNCDSSKFDYLQVIRAAEHGIQFFELVLKYLDEKHSRDAQIDKNENNLLESGVEVIFKELCKKAHEVMMQVFLSKKLDQIGEKIKYQEILIRMYE